MPLRRFCSASIVALAVLIWAGSAHASPEPITSCGQTVLHWGVLTADLDCSATTGPAVSLLPHARLDLAGFTLTATDTGVQCATARCKISGPGTIRRPTYDATVETYGIRALFKARIRDIVFENWLIAVEVLGPVDIRGCVMRDGGWGVVAEKAKIADSVFSNNGIGVHGWAGSHSGPGFGSKFIFSRERLIRSTFTGNGIDVASYKRPSLHHTSCSTSDMLTLAHEPFAGGDEWDVCP